MNKERETVRCVQCELVQWADHANCRRCGQVLPASTKCRSALPKRALSSAVLQLVGTNWDGENGPLDIQIPRAEFAPECVLVC